MTVNEVYLIYFSPTHTSKQIAEAIVQGAGIKNIFPINVTQQAAEEVVIPTSALAIVVVPVYGGHVAPLAMERLRNIRGLDAPTVLVAVYGNRAYEKALMELDAFATPHGMKVIAGATFIGEHSYSEVSMADSYPWSNPDLFVKQSPLFNADKIHTPLLFLHGDADVNVPVGESIQMFTALKLLGRETAFVAVTGQDHHIVDYGKRIQWQNTIFAWFAKWLQDDATWWNAIYKPKNL